MAREIHVLAWPKDANAARNAYTSLSYSQVPAVDPTVVVSEHRWTPRVLLARYDIWHAHWPDHYLGKPLLRRIPGTLAVLGFAILCHLRGAKVVWTVHNLKPHDRTGQRQLRLFYKVWIWVTDAVVHLSPTGAAAALDLYPGLRSKPSCVLWHGPYRVTGSAALSRAAARSRLGLVETEPLIGFIGAPRPYKGLDDLTAAHSASQSQTGAQLTVLRSQAPGVRSLPGPVDQDRLETLVRACDLIALPYRNILNSGSMLHVLSAGGRVLVPDFSSLVESAKHVTTGTTTFYDHADGLTADVLVKAVEHAVAQPDTPPISDEAVDDAWREISRGLVGLYHQLVPSR